MNLPLDIDHTCRRDYEIRRFESDRGDMERPVQTVPWGDYVLQVFAVSALTLDAERRCPGCQWERGYKEGVSARLKEGVSARLEETP